MTNSDTYLEDLTSLAETIHDCRRQVKRLLTNSPEKDSIQHLLADAQAAIEVKCKSASDCAQNALDAYNRRLDQLTKFKDQHGH